MTDSHSSEITTAAPAHGRNHLAGELSPYLLQHADNPVQWYPWGEEAFARARKEDKPIFLSIGYATCHWCHVMEHESFEDETVARLMNSNFINVKVDREERPDIDQVYMNVCQMLTGSGGWPLTIIMTPDKQPFFAATYIPKHSRYGRSGMVDLIPNVMEAWTTRRAELDLSAQQIVSHLQSINPTGGNTALERDLAGAAFRELGGRFDSKYGGFGSAPKFPSPHNLIFLLRHGRITGADRATEMVVKTLDEMRRGGIYDHLGFGFHRYSTDREWLVPHFEKMLYDQAMLVLAYTEAYAATGDQGYAQVAGEIITYVNRDMRSPEGAYFSAEDADSEGVEGKFYVWTQEELAELLPEDLAGMTRSVWNASLAGNFADEASGEKTGQNILHTTAATAELARSLEMDEQVLKTKMESIRSTLLAAREKRVRPLLDDKVLADWNGLMVAALARAGRVLDEPAHVNAARRAATFVFDAMRDEKGRLLHRYRNSSVSVPAFLDDYAFLTWGLLELYDATLEPQYLAQAVDLQRATTELFWDSEHGGFFFTATDNEKLLVRQKDVYDGAIPSGNSVLMANLVRLHKLTGQTELAEQADALLRVFAARVNQTPSAHCHLVSATAAAASGIEVVIAGDPEAEDTGRLIDTYRALYLPQAVLLVLSPGAEGNALRKLAPFAEGYTPVEGKAAAYVCRDFACQLPTTDASELKKLLLEAAKPTDPDQE